MLHEIMDDVTKVFLQIIYFSIACYPHRVIYGLKHQLDNRRPSMRRKLQ